MSYEELAGMQVLELSYADFSQALAAESRAIVLRQPSPAVPANHIFELDSCIGSHRFYGESAHWDAPILGSGYEC
jgi:predicted TIM-barrel enzyme